MLWRAWVILPSLLFVLFSGTRTAWADPVSTSSSPVLRIRSGELFFNWITDDPFGRKALCSVAGSNWICAVDFPWTVFKGRASERFRLGTSCSQWTSKIIRP